MMTFQIVLKLNYLPVFRVSSTDCKSPNKCICSVPVVTVRVHVPLELMIILCFV